jgi:hypothetical protein
LQNKNDVPVPVCVRACVQKRGNETVRIPSKHREEGSCATKLTHGQVWSKAWGFEIECSKRMCEAKRLAFAASPCCQRRKKPGPPIILLTLPERPLRYHSRNVHSLVDTIAPVHSISNYFHFVGVVDYAGIECPDLDNP